MAGRNRWPAFAASACSVQYSLCRSLLQAIWRPSRPTASTPARPSRFRSAPRRAAITISPGAPLPATSAATSREIRTSWCKTCPAPVALPAATGSRNTMERDGRTLVVMNRALPQLALIGDPNASFDPLQLTWLGSLSSYKDDAYLMTINARHPVQVAQRSAHGRQSRAPRRHAGRLDQRHLRAHRARHAQAQHRDHQGLSGRQPDLAGDGARRGRRPVRRYQRDHGRPSDPVAARRSCAP